VTSDVLFKLLAASAGERLVDLRDSALLLTAFASGGRRRSEVAALRVEDLVDEERVCADPNDKKSPSLPCLSIHLVRTETTTRDDDAYVLLIGRAVSALKQWLSEAGKGRTGVPAHRPIGKHRPARADAATVNLMLKARVSRPVSTCRCFRRMDGDSVI
jgi:integrase